MHGRWEVKKEEVEVAFRQRPDLPADLPTDLPTYLPTYLPDGLTARPAYLSAFLPTDLPTYLSDGRTALIGGSSSASRRLRLCRTDGRTDGPTNLARTLEL